MKKSKFALSLLFFIVAGIINLSAVDFQNGNIKLIINEKTGGFSLFYLANSSEDGEESGAKSGGEPLFNKDPKTSFFAVNTPGNTLYPGKSWYFKTIFNNSETEPSVMYESQDLLIQQTFSFINTANSDISNGIKITFEITNAGDKPLPVGLRFLVDTHLGEGRKNAPFIIGSQNIIKETIINNSSGETHWISRGEKLSLMGSIEVPDEKMGKNPDFIHFANWKKLNDVSWKAKYFQGKSFNLLPYSIGDSAVCYYYEPETLAPGDSSLITILLAVEDEMGFALPDTAVSAPARNTGKTAGANASGTFADNNPANFSDNEKDSAVLVLQQMLSTLEKFISGEISLSEEDLAEIEQSIARHKARYGL